MRQLGLVDFDLPIKKKKIMTFQQVDGLAVTLQPSAILATTIDWFWGDPLVAIMLEIVMPVFYSKVLDSEKSEAASYKYCPYLFLSQHFIQCIVMLERQIPN